MTDEQANERPHLRVVSDKAVLRAVSDNTDRRFVWGKADFWGRWWQAMQRPHQRFVWDKADFWGCWSQATQRRHLRVVSDKAAWGRWAHPGAWYRADWAAMSRS